MLQDVEWIKKHQWYVPIARQHVGFMVFQEINDVVTFTTKVEYILAWNCCAQILWIQQQLEDYEIKVNHTPIKYDNSSAINLSKNPMH